MKVIDAFWDEKVLKTKVVELIIEKSACLNDLVNYDFSGFGYAIAKVPTGLLEITGYLENNRFNFIEQQFAISINLNKELSLAPKYFKFVNQFEVFESKESSFRLMIEDEINKKIFRTDRIFIDHKIDDSENKSVSRYLNWLNDIYAKPENTKVYLLKKKQTNDIVGFHIFQENETGTIDGLLGGMFSAYSNLGLGFLYIYMPLLELKKIGYSKAVTRISSNNTVHHHYFSLGYELNKIASVFRRIN